MIATRTTLLFALASALVACDKGGKPPMSSPPPDAGVARPTPPRVPPPGEPPTATASPDAGATAPAAPSASTGSITGVIHFDGALPEMPVLDRSRDSNCPQGETRAGYVVTGPSGVLRGAVVHLPVGVNPGAAPPPVPAIVDQKECLYRPTVTAVVAGQNVRVKNSDPTTHNVRGVKDGENLFNVIHMASGPDKQLPIDAPAGQAVELKCDIHPWMHSWVYVHDSAWFDITGFDGKFSLEGLPPGSYELEVWHPYLGTKKSKKIVVEAGKAATAELPAYGAKDYKAPAP